MSNNSKNEHDEVSTYVLTDGHIKYFEMKTTYREFTHVAETIRIAMEMKERQENKLHVKMYWEVA